MKIIYFAPGPSQMEIASAFLSQFLKRERDCKCKKWRTFDIKGKFIWQNNFNQDIKGKTNARVSS